MYDCPACDRAFETRRGLGVHHSSVHGERLPNRTCGHCGEQFYCEYEKKYCSDECRSKGITNTGPNAPNYRSKKKQTRCRICGDEFEYYPSNKEGLYCPTCVKTKQWQELPSIEGEHNPRWNGGTVRIDCEVCDRTVERYPSNAGEVVVCSEKCRRDWLSDEFTGEGHPNWKDGGNEDYGKGWNAVRKAALERDDYACVICDTTKAELGRNPDVHHIVPVRAFAESADFEVADAHFLENVVSLCIRCHRKAEFGKIDPDELREAIGVQCPENLPDRGQRGGDCE